MRRYHEAMMENVYTQAGPVKLDRINTEKKLCMKN